MTPVSNQGYWLKVEEPYLSELAVVLLHEGGVDRDLCGRKRGCSNELKSAVARLLVSVLLHGRYCGNRCSPDEFPGEPEEGLFEVVVRLGGDLEVLEGLLPMEGHSRSLHLALLEY